MSAIFLEPAVEVSPYCWMFNLGPNNLGVHRTEGWCLSADERTVFFDSEDKCILLFPLLELNAGMFINFLLQVQRERPEYAEAISQFPKIMLLKHVFHVSVSDYWPGKALTWLASDSTIQHAFKDELEEFVNNKVMGQAVRHKAKKILRSLRPATA